MGTKKPPEPPPVAPYVAVRLRQLRKEGAIKGKQHELEDAVTKVNERDAKPSKKARR